ncbi:M23 family metallopeptidase [Thermoactinomyces sp. DSM 45891]|uniref:M23 family metallopeptidase n=1 Tax=Thermoactinomyces sp. DSM 45891 TaxID=1761907 RepID=UPI0015A69BCC|nr:M23 family metallopeptidase [Thermoactinomyces sp. DSM 45891]
MKEWGVYNKSRRQEQIRLIRQGSHKINSAQPDQMEISSEDRAPVALLTTQEGEYPSWVAPPLTASSYAMGGMQPWGKAKPWNKKEKKRNKPVKFLVQMVIAATLFLGTTLAVQHQTKVGQMLTSALQHNMDVSTIAKLIDQVVGENATVLPAFVGTFLEQAKPGDQLGTSWQVPSKGRVFLPYTSERKGMVLQLVQNEQVHVARDGWVSFVGTKEGLGQTVIVEHEDGSESWYGFLDRPTIKAKAAMKKGDVIGKAEDKQGQSFLYFAIQKQNTWLDPTKVISFGSPN